MGLLERLNAIASDRQSGGKHDAALALAAWVLLDKNNEIQFDADDLPGTLQRLGVNPASMRWVKLDIPVSSFVAPEGDPNNWHGVVSDVMTLPVGAFIENAVVATTPHVSETDFGFLPSFGHLKIALGYDNPGDGHYIVSPTDVWNETRIVTGAQFSSPTAIEIPLYLDVEVWTGGEDSHALTLDQLTASTGSVIIWVLLGILP